MRYRRYDEAIQCHERAAEFLQEALNLTTSVKAVESIHLQCEYHRKQKELALFKKEQFENLKKNIEKQKLKMARFNQADLKDVNSGSLHTAINKTMDEADSIVELLYKRNVKNDLDSLGDNDSIDNGVVKCMISDTLLVSGLKEPKSDNIVIEELQIVNQQLRKFINQLLNQLEVSTQETKDLKLKVASLESERNRYLEQQHNSQPSPQTVQIIPPMMTDSISDSFPFIFTPCIDLSPGDEDRELPQLPPLEMPDFDFESLINNMKLKSQQHISQEAADILK